MPRRGEKIGDAYVRIHADGSGIDRETRESFEDLDPVMRDLGKRHAVAYDEGRRAQMAKQAPLLKKEILKGLDFQRGVLDAKADAFNKGFVKALRKKFRALAGDKDIGNRMGAILMEQVQEGMIDEIDLSRLFSQMQQEVDDEGNVTFSFDDAGAKKIAALRAQAVRDIQAAEKEGARAIERDQEEHNKSLADLMRDFEKARVKIAKDGNQADLDEWQKFHDRAQAMWTSYYAALSSDDAEFRRRTLDRLQASAETYRESLARLSGTTEAYAEHTRRLAQAEKDEEKTQRDSIKTREDALSQMRQLDEMILRIRKGTARWGENMDHVRRRMREMNDRLSDFGDEAGDAERHLRLMRLGLITLTPRIDRARNRFGGLADAVGRLTGRGSRNNFLNFVGSVNRNFLRLTSTVTLGFAKMTIAALKFTKTLATGGISFKDLKTLGISAIQALAGGVTTLITFAIVVAAVGASMGILATAISGVVAALAALISTVAFATAGILPLIGLLTPLVVNVGIAIAAFKSLSDAQKDALKNDLQPLIDQFKNLGDIAADVLFRDVGKWARQLAPELGMLEEGVHRIASAMRDTIGAAVDAATKEGSGFEQFLERLTTKTESHRAFLATSTRKLGQIFTNVISGLGGFFIAMIPSMNRLLGFLRDITGAFSEWANTKKGRDEIRSFFDKVGDSASALGDFLGDAVRLLAKLFDLGKGTGDQMFRDMAEAMGRFTDYLSSPEGQAAAEDWFQWGKDLAETIGEMVVAAAKFIGVLDTPGSRKALTFILDAVTAIFNFFIENENVTHALFDSFATGLYLVEAVADAIEDIFDLLTAPLGTSGIGDALNALTLGIVPGLQKTLGFVGDIAGALFGHDETASWVTDFTKALTGDLWAQSAEGAEAIRASLDQITGAATAATRELIALELAENDVLTTGNGLGVSTRTLISAALGHKNAINDVRQALFDQWKETGELTAEQSDLLHSLGLTEAGFRKQRNALLNANVATQNFKDKLKGLPKDVKINIRESGIRATTNGIAKVVAAAKELAPNLNRRQIKTIIEASGVEPTKKRIKDVLKRVRELTNEPARVQIEADAARFRSVITQIDRDVKVTDKKKGTPKFDGDTKAFDARAKHVQQQLTILDAKTADPKVNLDDDEFLRAITGANTALNNIEDEHVTIFVHTVHTNDGGGNGNGAGNGNGGEDVTPREVANGGKLITIPQITINESADGKATAQELLNHIAAAGY